MATLTVYLWKPVIYYAISNSYGNGSCSVFRQRWNPVLIEWDPPEPVWDSNAGYQLIDETGPTVIAPAGAAGSTKPSTVQKICLGYDDTGGIMIDFIPNVIDAPSVHQIFCLPTDLGESTNFAEYYPCGNGPAYAIDVTNLPVSDFGCAVFAESSPEGPFSLPPVQIYSLMTMTANADMTTANKLRAYCSNDGGQTWLADSGSVGFNLTDLSVIGVPNSICWASPLPRSGTYNASTGTGGWICYPISGQASAWQALFLYDPLSSDHIEVLDTSGNSWIFFAENNFASGATQPTWNFTFGTTTSESTGLNWLCAGLIMDVFRQQFVVTSGFKSVSIGSPATGGSNDPVMIPAPPIRDHANSMYVFNPQVPQVAAYVYIDPLTGQVMIGSNATATGHSPNLYAAAVSSGVPAATIIDARFDPDQGYSTSGFTGTFALHLLTKDSGGNVNYNRIDVATTPGAGSVPFASYVVLTPTITSSYSLGAVNAVSMEVTSALDPDAIANVFVFITQGATPFLSAYISDSATPTTFNLSPINKYAQNIATAHSCMSRFTDYSSGSGGGGSSDIILY